MNKYERINRRVERAKQAEQLKKTTVPQKTFIYKNHKKSELILPKHIWIEGVFTNTVQPGQEFQGYFHDLLNDRPPMCVLVREADSPEEIVLVIESIEITAKPVKIIEHNLKKENKKVDEKLILDQPETVTTEGTIEHVVKSGGKRKLNERISKAKPTEDQLINEDPEGSVDILFE